MRIKLFIISLAACMMVACCAPQKEDVPVYVWHRITSKTNMDSLQRDFHFWKEHGVTGICVETRKIELISEAAARAHAEGLEYHAWIPSMLRSGLPHEWYAVNRLGQSADDHPNYIKNYRFLDPANPEVQDYLMNLYKEVAQIPDVDYVRLDFIRYPDVILSSALQEFYGLEETDTEYAAADYCYCDYCTKTFYEQTGIDIKSVEDPSKIQAWAQFRCDQVTLFVDKVGRAIHELGKKVSVDVFPGPQSYAPQMVRQQWSQWMVDMFFPMNYNDYYEESLDWIPAMVQEEVQAAGNIPVMSGLRVCKDWHNRTDLSKPQNFGLTPDELFQAIPASLNAGAAGICIFSPERMAPEHWDALDQALNNLANQK